MWQNWYNENESIDQGCNHDNRTWNTKQQSPGAQQHGKNYRRDGLQKSNTQHKQNHYCFSQSESWNTTDYPIDLTIKEFVHDGRQHDDSLYLPHSPHEYNLDVRDPHLSKSSRCLNFNIQEKPGHSDIPLSDGRASCESTENSKADDREIMTATNHIELSERNNENSYRTATWNNQICKPMPIYARPIKSHGVCNIEVLNETPRNLTDENRETAFELIQHKHMTEQDYFCKQLPMTTNISMTIDSRGDFMGEDNSADSLDLPVHRINSQSGDHFDRMVFMKKQQNAIYGPFKLPEGTNCSQYTPIMESASKMCLDNSSTLKNIDSVVSNPSEDVSFSGTFPERLNVSTIQSSDNRMKDHSNRVIECTDINTENSKTLNSKCCGEMVLKSDQCQSKSFPDPLDYQKSKENISMNSNRKDNDKKLDQMREVLKEKDMNVFYSNLYDDETPPLIIDEDVDHDEYVISTHSDSNQSSQAIRDQKDVSKNSDDNILHMDLSAVQEINQSNEEPGKKVNNQSDSSEKDLKEIFAQSENLSVKPETNKSSLSIGDLSNQSDQSELDSVNFDLKNSENDNEIFVEMSRTDDQQKYDKPVSQVDKRLQTDALNQNNIEMFKEIGQSDAQQKYSKTMWQVDKRFQTSSPAIYKPKLHLIRKFQNDQTEKKLKSDNSTHKMRNTYRSEIHSTNDLNTQKQGGQFKMIKYVPAKRRKCKKLTSGHTEVGKKSSSKNYEHKLKKCPKLESGKENYATISVKSLDIGQKVKNSSGSYDVKDTSKSLDLSVSSEGEFSAPVIPEDLEQCEEFFWCHVCEKSIKTEEESIRHQKTHCKRTTANLNFYFLTVYGNMTKHWKGYNKEDKCVFLCGLCETTIPYTYGFKRHVQCHGNGYKCDQCDRSFRSEDSLSEHHRSHTGEKPYTCTECGEKYSNRNSLYSHRQVHYTKPCKCEFCGRTMSSKGSLTVHRRLHTGDNPYHCRVCDKSYPQNVQLKLHMRAHKRNGDI